MDYSIAWHHLWTLGENSLQIIHYASWLPSQILLISALPELFNLFIVFLKFISLKRHFLLFLFDISLDFSVCLLELFYVTFLLLKFFLFLSKSCLGLLQFYLHQLHTIMRCHFTSLEYDLAFLALNFGVWALFEVRVGIALTFEEVAAA